LTVLVLCNYCPWLLLSFADYCPLAVFAWLFLSLAVLVPGCSCTLRCSVIGCSCPLQIIVLGCSCSLRLLSLGFLCLAAYCPWMFLPFANIVFGCSSFAEYCPLAVFAWLFLSLVVLVLCRFVLAVILLCGYPWGFMPLALCNEQLIIVPWLFLPGCSCPWLFLVLGCSCTLWCIGRSCPLQIFVLAVIVLCGF